MESSDDDRRPTWGPRIPLRSYALAHFAVAVAIIGALFWRGRGLALHAILPADDTWQQSAISVASTAWWWITLMAAMGGVALHLMFGWAAFVTRLTDDIQPGALRDPEAALQDLFENQRFRDAFPQPSRLLDKSLAAVIPPLKWLTPSGWRLSYGIGWSTMALLASVGVVVARRWGWDIPVFSRCCVWLMPILALVAGIHITALALAARRPRAASFKNVLACQSENPGRIYDQAKTLLLDSFEARKFASGLLADRPQPRQHVDAVDIVLLAESPPQSAGRFGPGRLAAGLLDFGGAAMAIAAWAAVLLGVFGASIQGFAISGGIWAVGWISALSLFRSALSAHLTFRFRSRVYVTRITGNYLRGERKAELRVAVHAGALVSEAAWEPQRLLRLGGLMVEEVELAFQAPRFGVSTWGDKRIESQFGQLCQLAAGTRGKTIVSTTSPSRRPRPQLDAGAGWNEPPRIGPAHDEWSLDEP